MVGAPGGFALLPRICHGVLTIRMTWRVSTFKLEFSEVDLVAVLPEFIGLGATDFGDHAANVLQLLLYFTGTSHMISMDMRVHCKNAREQEYIPVGCVPSERNRTAGRLPDKDPPRQRLPDRDPS